MAAATGRRPVQHVAAELAELADLGPAIRPARFPMAEATSFTADHRRPIRATPPRAPRPGTSSFPTCKSIR